MTTIEELKKDKKDVENQINKLLSEFSNKHHVLVEDVKMPHGFVFDPVNNTYVYMTELDIELYL